MSTFSRLQCKIAALSLVIFLTSCATTSTSTTSISITSTSTGFAKQQQARIKLPEGVPNRVGVIPFAGDDKIGIQATDQFASGLIAIGFEVVERQQLQAILGEILWQQSEFIVQKTREKLAEQLGLQGLFVGSVTGESSSMWVDTHLNVRFVSVETGLVLWAVEAHDPRSMGWSMDVHTSIVHTVRKALDLLRKDLLNFPK